MILVSFISESCYYFKNWFIKFVCEDLFLRPINQNAPARQSILALLNKNMLKVKNRKQGDFIVLGMVIPVFHPAGRVAALMRSAAT